MKSNKYYTPEIEEFYIGFEFEKKEIVSKNSFLEEDWVNQKCDIQDLFQVLKDYTEDNIFVKEDYRVKYLDQEDIESLGFNNMKRVTVDWYELEKHFEDGWSSYGYWNFIRLLHDRELNRIKIIAYEYRSDNDENLLYQGSCKNKSELKKLMKQLNINDSQ